MARHAVPGVTRPHATPQPTDLNALPESRRDELADLARFPSNANESMNCKTLVYVVLCEFISHWLV